MSEIVKQIYWKDTPQAMAEAMLAKAAKEVDAGPQSRDKSAGYINVADGYMRLAKTLEETENVVNVRGETRPATPANLRDAAEAI